jgi:GTP cyclohydrolase I
MESNDELWILRTTKRYPQEHPTMLHETDPLYKNERDFDNLWRNNVTDLPDIQNTKSNHNIYLENVGIEDLKLPILVMQKDGRFQQTIANINCYVDLEGEIKGISMSRLLEVLHEYTYKPLNNDIITDICDVLRQRSGSKRCKLYIEFPYFMEKCAPASHKKGYLNHTMRFTCVRDEDKMTMKYGVEVVVTSLCPCSKEISDNSAHNQKCFVDVNFETDKWVWVEDVILAIEKCGSSEIYSILKRPDEKVVTERAYNNPLFVEDIARNVFVALENIDGITDFDISIKSDESIHLHKAVALTSRSCRSKDDIWLRVKKGEI